MCLRILGSFELNDYDLIEIVKSHNSELRVLVASRDGLSEMVSSAILETADFAAVRALLLNITARISESSFTQIAEFCSLTTNLHEPLVNRPDVAWLTIQNIIPFVSKRLLSTISKKWDIPKFDLVKIAQQYEEDRSREADERRVLYQVGGAMSVWPSEVDSGFTR